MSSIGPTSPPNIHGIPTPLPKSNYALRLPSLSLSLSLSLSTLSRYSHRYLGGLVTIETRYFGDSKHTQNRPEQRLTYRISGNLSVMPMAAGPASPKERAPPVGPAVVPIQSPPMMVSDAFAKDAILAWFRGEFAAANAIIDALCGHIAQLGGGTVSEYESLFAAIHRRRLNWIPVLQMQKYHSIADVAVELRRVAERKMEEKIKCSSEKKSNDVVPVEVPSDEKGKESNKAMECVENDTVGNGGEEIAGEEYPPDSEITDSGSQEVLPSENNANIYFNHEDCITRAAQVKLTKGFVAKEQVKGRSVNVVKGLKLYEDVFTDSELSELTNFVNQLRAAGQNGELSGDTFILFNKQMKGNKREMIQFGVPIFERIKEEATSNKQTSNIEPIPALLRGAIDCLVQWQLIPEHKKPNGCIINFFDEEEYSQPFLKPPHLDQPVSTLLLSESTMAFGRVLVNDNDGNYRGPLMLSLKEGSMLVMRGNSADMARHAICPSPNKRASITFFRVRPESSQGMSPPTSPTAGAMALWQPGIGSPYAMPNGALGGYDTMDTMTEWGVLSAPVVMLAAPTRPMVLSPKKMPHGGTGVFLPWTIRSRKPAKRLPPRAQKGRLLALPSPVETQVANSVSETAIILEGK